MTSYIPQEVYGVIPGTYGQMGLIPWPKHMTPQLGSESDPSSSSGIELTKKGEAYVERQTLAGVVNLTLDPKDRLQLSTTIEQLINMLDDLGPDADLEPDLDGEPWLGWTERGQGASDDDDREADAADLEATALERHGKGFFASGADDNEYNGDDEPSLGGFSYGGGGLEYDLELDTADAEPSLAATEVFNQDDAWHVNEDQWNIEDGERDAGDEPERDAGDEPELDAGDYDHPGIIWGGGSDDSGRVPA